MKDKEKKLGVWIKSNRFMVVVFLIMCLIGGGIVGGLSLTKDSGATANKDSDADQVVIIDEDTGKTKTVDADSEEAKEAEKKGDVVKDSTSEKAAANNSNQGNSTSNKNNGSNTSKSSGNSSSSNKSGGSSGGSSNGGNSSGGSKGGSSGGSSAAKPTTHTHNWVAHEATRQVPVTICSYCREKNPDGYHHQEHALDGISSSSLNTYEDETYTDYYCSICGAKK